MNDNEKIMGSPRSQVSDEAKEIPKVRRVTRPPADLNDISRDYETDQEQEGVIPQVGPQNLQPLSIGAANLLSDKHMNYVNSPPPRAREDSVGHKPSLKGMDSLTQITSVQKKKPVPLPEEFLNENIADIDDHFNQKRQKKETSMHSKSRSVSVVDDNFLSKNILTQKLPQHDRQNSHLDVIYQEGNKSSTNVTRAVSAIDTDMNVNPSRLQKQSATKHSATVKFGKAEFFDYDKNISPKHNELKVTRNKTEIPQKKKKWTAGLESTFFKRPQLSKSVEINVKDREKNDVFYNSDGTPMNEKDIKKLKYLRQKFMIALGVGSEYQFQTQDGVEASKINEEMMREILTAQNSARDKASPHPTIQTQNIDTKSHQSKKSNVSNHSMATVLKDPDNDGVSYINIINKFCCNASKTFDEMNSRERQDRVQYLWKRLRLVVKHRGLLQRVMHETHMRERQRFGLDPKISQRLKPEEELESMIKYVNNDGLTDLPWYIISPKKTFYRVQNLQIQCMTWITVVLTPMNLVFAMIGTDLADKLLWLIWVNDISWCVEICISFFVASANNRTFSSISKAYLKSYFIFDVLATLPPMITMQKNPTVNLLKFLRFVHISEMFTPFRKLIDCVMEGAIAKKRSDVFQLIVLFSSALLFGHIFACGWIAIGAQDDGWLIKMQTLPLDEGGDENFANYEAAQIYVFSLYWVFTVLTTVGYGDFAGSNSNEFLFSICLEFCGLTFFALLTGLITPLVTPETDFQGMLMQKTDNLDIWIKKLQQANSTIRPLFIPGDLYLSISETVEEAFKNDHNLIIEEFGFYQQLSPKQQTKIINLIFEDFKKNFRHFFDPCDRGFINEAIINLYSRRYQMPKTGRIRLVRPSYKMHEIYFIMEGTFALYHEKLKLKGKHENDQPAVLMPRHAVFGDYQLLYDLYPKVEFCPFVPSIMTKPEIKQDLGQDAAVEEFRIMCLDGETFLELCDLYPATAQSLKIQGLKKRKMFMTILKLQEEEAKQDKTALSCIVYKGSMRAHSKYGDRLTSHIEMEQDDLRNCTIDGQRDETVLSQQNLDPEEQDIEETDYEVQNKVNESKKVLKKMKKILEAVEPILFDLQDGTLKRTAPSNFQERRESKNGLDFLDLQLERPEMDSSANSSRSNSFAKEDDNDVVSLKSKQQREVNKLVESVRKAKTAGGNSNSESTLNLRRNQTIKSETGRNNL